jgi:hypothetical protein
MKWKLMLSLVSTFVLGIPSVSLFGLTPPPLENDSVLRTLDASLFIDTFTINGVQNQID